MEKKYLIVNAGSTSKRYGLYYKDKNIFNLHIESKKLQPIARILKSKKLIKNNKEIKAIGIRIVSPGTYFQKHRIINKEYISKLKNSLHMAPLHIRPTLIEIMHLQKEFPAALIAGISDSEFHKTLPEIARLYAIPKKTSENLEIYKYGYHGISLKSILSQLKRIPPNIIICHLGGGSSITAIKNGKAVDTSMGFTPLEGLPMTTRVGDIDPGALIYLSKKLKLNLDNLESYLNSKCGYLGLSGISEDTKVLLKSKNKNAKLALDIFVYKVKKYIGAYIAILGGLDLLIFTGAIGYGSTQIRLRICKNLSIPNSKIKVMKTNEKEIIYKETKKIIN